MNAIRMITRLDRIFGFFCCGLVSLSAQPSSIPDVSATAQQLVAPVHGIFSPFKGGTSNKMPDGPVAGNGDVGLVMGGSSDQLRFSIGKADFWGVQRGSIARVGWLELAIPELKNATGEVDQNIGPATLTGKFTQNDSELSFTSWVSATTNLVIVELKNSGSQQLHFSSKLFDGLGTTGNESTYGATGASTWLKVSPDTMNVSIGNRLGMGPRGGFQGQIADLKIYDQAGAGHPNLEGDITANPLFHWPTSGKQGEHGTYVDFSGGKRCGRHGGCSAAPAKAVRGHGLGQRHVRCRFEFYHLHDDQRLWQ